jgi:trk system potassium uptake protein TrkH
MLVWLGGMGLIVLAVAILPLLGIGGRQMFKAETPGPMKDSKLTPRMTETAKGLWGVYAVITVLCILAYRWAGMSWFDAVVHAFTTMGLGGFSSHDASFGFWNSPTDRGGVDRLHADRRDELRDPLCRRSAAARRGLTCVTPRRACSSAGHPRQRGRHRPLPVGQGHLSRLSRTALRHSAFNVVSIATTTGYASLDYNLWPFFAPLWMLFLCSFATSAGIDRRRHQDDPGH